MRSFSFLVAGLLTVSLGSAALAATPTSITVPINEQAGSGEKGTATVTQKGDTVLVSMKLDGAPKDGQPAHIHLGTCAELNPKPSYPLKYDGNGTWSASIEDTSLEKLLKNVYSINVHKSATDLKTYVACGRLEAPKGTM